MKRSGFMAVAALAVVMLASAASYAQETVTLAIKGTQGKVLQYKMDMGGTLNFALEDAPVPKSKMSGENLAASVNIDAYLDTLEAGDDSVVFDSHMMMKKLTLGGLLQLPDMGAGAAPELVLTLNPRGGIDNVEVKNMKLPGGDDAAGGMMKSIPGLDSLGMNGMGLDTILPMLIGLIPPIFPEEPVAVGGVWTQKPSEDAMPLPIFPVIEIRYKLDAIDNGVAKILFKSKGKYDAGFINSFLSMIPELPMGDDQMSIKNIDLVMNWDIDGTMDFVIAEGLIKNVKAAGKVDVKGGGDISFAHPDSTTEPWNPKIQANLDINGGLEYVGEVSRADYEALFPPAPPEDENSGDEDGSGDDSGDSTEM